MYFDGLYVTLRYSGTHVLVGQSHSDRKVFEVSDTLKIHKIDVTQCAEHIFASKASYSYMIVCVQRQGHANDGVSSRT